MSDNVLFRASLYFLKTLVLFTLLYCKFCFLIDLIKDLVSQVRLLLLHSVQFGMNWLIIDLKLLQPFSPSVINVFSHNGIPIKFIIDLTGTDPVIYTSRFFDPYPHTSVCQSFYSQLPGSQDSQGWCGFAG